MNCINCYVILNFFLQYILLYTIHDIEMTLYEVAEAKCSTRIKLKYLEKDNKIIIVIIVF